MSLKHIVKLSNVNNLSDARYGAGMGVALMGFPLDTDSTVTTEQYSEITSWVSGPEFVAEFEHPDTNRILEILSLCKPDYIQVTSAQFLKELSHIDIPVILKWQLKNIQSVPQHTGLSFLLLEDDDADELSSAQKAKIKELSDDYSILLGTGIKSSNVESLFEELPISGIALKGGDEIRAGYKDYDELADILEVLEVD